MQVERHEVTIKLRLETMLVNKVVATLDMMRI